MTRDDDYLRELLLEFEADEDWVQVSELLLGPGDDETKRHYHVLLLCDAGMMTGVDEGLFRLTSAGHDFLELTRQSEAWEATKGASRKLGGASIQMLYRVAEGYARSKLSELGIPLA
ncbi:DUF2513 domain-containing protein [Salipiger abyssi]|uniref:DUF2513 domain-containing protein n=1 Tax=Salipiger abyssi TaxID=1250539 RepID=UPI001A8E4D9B|nr:DUF2513 domain-containing protein [Salipiger abyssi]MBN9890094.1 DUF2513 domain-containing protein [Salipiger abyssi]